jgi:hypothetical protein
MEWPSFAAAVGGSVVGVAGIAFGYIGGHSQRQHETELARRQRLYEDIRDAYVGLIDFLFDLQRGVGAAYSALRAKRENTPGPDTGDSDPIVARVMALGSQEVVDALEATIRALNSFYRIRDEAAKLEDETDRHLRNLDAREARDLYIKAQENVEKLIRAELRS